MGLCIVEPAHGAQKLAVNCISPRQVMATVGYKITCTASFDIDGTLAHLQFQNNDGSWKDANDGKKNWSGSELIFNRIYSNPKTDAYTIFRVLTDAQAGVNKSTISNTFETFVKPFNATKAKPTVKASQSSKSTTKFVTIPNFVGLEVQWLQTHRNAFPGVYFFFDGSSCAVSDVFSGAAIVVSQNPGAMEKRGFNSPVTLRTNC